MDDLMKRAREWLQSCVNAATRSGVPEEADLEAFILAHIDGEPARTQAVVEEGVKAWRVTSKVVVDENAALRARVAELEAELDAAHERLDEFGMRRDGTTATLVEGIDAMRARIDEYREWAHKGETATADLREVVEALRACVRPCKCEPSSGCVDADARTVLDKHPVKP